jgi:hypothetical protein
MAHRDLLDQKVIGQSGRLQRIQRWWRGIHPEKGVIVRGLTGWETLEETYRIVPVSTFTVKDVSGP